MSESNKPRPADREEEFVAADDANDSAVSEIGESVARLKGDE